MIEQVDYYEYIYEVLFSVLYLLYKFWMLA
jgi:hypothetical protein